MFKFFKNKKPVKSNEINLLSKTASLLIHAAKIDENYTNKEKLIIEKTLLELGISKEAVLDKRFISIGSPSFFFLKNLNIII